MTKLYDFHLICRIFLIVMNVIFWMILIAFGIYTYEYIMHHLHLFDSKAFMNNSTNIGQLKTFAYNYGIALLYLIIKIVIISIITIVFKKLPISQKLINQWLQDNEIDGIFGRSLCLHFRWYSYLSIKQFMEIHNSAKHERYYLLHNSKKPVIAKLFQKYDKYYSDDILNHQHTK